MHPATATEDRELGRYLPKNIDKDIANAVKPHQPPKGDGRKFAPALLAHELKRREEELAEWRPSFPSGFINRARDKWWPLLAIAEAAGNKWTQRALRAAMALEPEEQETAMREGPVNVLRRVVEATSTWPHDEISSAELDQALGGKQSPRWNAEQLKQVGLKPGRHYRGSKQLRSYLIEDIRKAGARYIRDAQDASRHV
jgi:hypothetical protein